MDETKLTPVELISRVIAERVDLLDEEDVHSSIVSGLQCMIDDAQLALDIDPESERAVELSQRFLVFAKVIELLGESLKTIIDKEQMN